MNSPSTVENGVVHYDAPSDCPTVSAYFGQVEQRLGSNWQPALEELAQRVNVTITRGAERYLGTLELVNVRGERLRRNIVRLAIRSAHADRFKAKVKKPKKRSTGSRDVGAPREAPEGPFRAKGMAASNGAASSPACASRTNVNISQGVTTFAAAMPNLSASSQLGERPLSASTTWSRCAESMRCVESNKRFCEDPLDHPARVE